MKLLMPMKRGGFCLAPLVLFFLSGCAGTDPIKDEAGRRVEGSIASLERVELPGGSQSILLRGHDREAPVLLWLAGGPCGSEIGWTRKHLSDLEEDVVFVNWEQPGAGKSFGAADFKTITVEDYVTDLIALSEYLGERFDQEKIFLAGHSWGSIIGLMAADRRPDLYHAYIGMGQQVNAEENDLINYQTVLEGARRAGDTGVVEKLEAYGPPPYSREEGSRYVYLFQRMPHYTTAPATHPEPSFWTMLFPREYNLFDSVNMVRGLIRGVEDVYPQVADLDFEKTVPRLELPVFFMTGRYDETCDQDIAYRYYQGLQAPRKEFIWFEESGHNMVYQETEFFIQQMREKVLPLSQS